jgi:nickel transport protein
MSLKFHHSLLITLIFLIWFSPAHAHKVKLFATVTGDTIVGYVYFPGGELAKSVTVKIISVDNQLSETVTTNDNGEFQFHAKYRTTYQLVADLGEGHRAEYTLNSNELSDSLPTINENCKEKSSLSETMKCFEGQEKTSEPPTPPEKVPTTSPPIPPSNENLLFSQQQLTDSIEKIVSKQLKPLREQLEAYQEKIFIHDVLGGIGYIFGVMGLLFYFAKSNRRN